jgi:hypothetical protein
MGNSRSQRRTEVRCFECGDELFLKDEQELELCRNCQPLYTPWADEAEVVNDCG